MSQDADELIPRATLARKRYGKHPRTLVRWVASGVYPPPDLVINERSYWRRSTVERHERETVAARAAAA